MLRGGGVREGAVDDLYCRAVLRGDDSSLFSDARADEVETHELNGHAIAKEKGRVREASFLYERRTLSLV